MAFDSTSAARVLPVRPVDYHRDVIPCIVLAAGKSTRMGRPKALLPVDARDRFLTRIVRTLRAVPVDDVVVVLGYEAAVIEDHLAGSGVLVRTVVNPDYESGQLSSVLTGLRAVDRPGVTAMLLTLVDVPLVTAPTVRAVLERYRTSHAPIVRPVSGGRHGHPVLVDRSLFDALRAANPSDGAKPVVRAHVSTAGDVPVEDEGAFRDIDTPEEYARAVSDGVLEGSVPPG